MTEHRTDWRRLSIRTEDGTEVEALGWRRGYGWTWVLDRVVDGNSSVYNFTVTDLGPADVLVLPAPSGPVERKSWGWLCGETEAEDLEGADGWADELPQHIADSRAIAAHIRGLPSEPTLAEDVAALWVWAQSAPSPLDRVALTRILDAALNGEAK